MIRTLDKYVVKETAVPFLVGFGISLLMLVGNLLYYQLPRLIRYQVSFDVAARWMLAKVPEFAYMSLPVGMLVGTALVVNRLARENEITMMRMARASVKRVFLPIFAVGVLASVATFILGETLVPLGNAKADRIFNQFVYNQAIPTLASDLSFKVKDFWIYVGRVWDEGGRKIAEPVIAFWPQAVGSSGGQLITAKSGTSRDGRTWQLHGAIIYLTDTAGNIVTVRQAKDAKSPCIIDLGEDIAEYRKYQETLESPFRIKMGYEMSMREIAKERKKFADAPFRAVMFDVDYYSKTAVPFACLIFALVAAPLCFVFARSGNFVGVLIAVIVLFFYYVMWTMGQNIGRLGLLHPLIAAWSQNILFGVIGAILMYRIE
jgi:lipopolysaccharide export system permease protein